MFLVKDRLYLKKGPVSFRTVRCCWYTAETVFIPESPVQCWDTVDGKKSGILRKSLRWGELFYWNTFFSSYSGSFFFNIKYVLIFSCASQNIHCFLPCNLLTFLRIPLFLVFTYFHDWWAPLQFCSHQCQVGHSIVDRAQHESSTKQIPKKPVDGVACEKPAQITRRSSPLGSHGKWQKPAELHWIPLGHVSHQLVLHLLPLPLVEELPASPML